MQPQLRWASLKIEKEIIIGTIPLQAPLSSPPSFSEIAMDLPISPSAPPLDAEPPPYQERKCFNVNTPCLMSLLIVLPYNFIVV